MRALLYIAVAWMTVTAVAGYFEHVQMHSVFPPILADFWENGLHYWSFGSSTVVTDEYIRLTTHKADAKGYFWNRHPNHIESFVINATLRFKKRHAGWFADATDGGIALWYTAAAPRHMATNFFGNIDTFDGIGVVLDHGNVVSVLVNQEQQIHGLVESRRGSCKLKNLDNNKVTLSLAYDADQRTAVVQYNVWTSDLVPGVDVACTSVDDVKLPLRNYFGLTASNSEKAQAEHDVISVYVRSSKGDGKVEQDEEELTGLHLFDRAREKRLQAEWNGRADEPFSKERPAKSERKSEGDGQEKDAVESD